MKRTGFVVAGFGLVAVLSAAGEESGTQRLENAQRGMAEASWPRKPDNRLSPLSGMMRETAKISPKSMGQEKEFRASTAGGWQKEARTGARSAWEGAAGRNWEEARWHQTGEATSTGTKHREFQPGQELTREQTLSYRKMEREVASGWASRPARTGTGGEDGSLRMYEGRLTRVREQVWQEETTPRELGPGRQEKFSPREVERMLSRPVGELRGAAREQSPAASPLAAADN